MPSVLIMQRDPQVAEHLRRQVELLGHEAVIAESVSQAVQILLDSDVAAKTTDVEAGESDIVGEVADGGEQAADEVGTVDSVLIEPADMREAARVGEISDRRALRQRSCGAASRPDWRAWVKALVSHYHVPVAMVGGAIVTLLLLWVGQAIWGDEAAQDTRVDRYNELTVNTIKKASSRRVPKAEAQGTPAAVKQPTASPANPDPPSSDTSPPTQRPSDQIDWVIRAKWRKAPASKRNAPERANSDAPPQAPPEQSPDPSNAAPPTDNIDPWLM